MVVSAPEHLLSAIADPNIALLLVVLGAFGIYAEFCLPGLLAPGVIGAIFLFLGLTALGAATLIDTAHSDLHVRWSTAIALSIPFALITSFLLSVAIRARRNKVVCV